MASPVYFYRRHVYKSFKEFFSVDADSPIYPLTERLLKKHLDSVTFHESIKALGWDKEGQMSINVGCINTIAKFGLLAIPFLEIKYSPIKRLGTGMFIGISTRNIDDTFSYKIIQPRLNIYEFGWANEYGLLMKKRFRINASLLNAVAVYELIDKGQKESVLTKSGYSDRAKRIANNYYWLVMPGVEFAVQPSIKLKQLWITAGTKYQTLIGSSTYGTNEDFGSWFFSAGVSFINL